MSLLKKIIPDTTRIFIDAYRQGRNHGLRRLSAGLAYYLLFSLAPLVLLVVMIGGVFIGASHSASIITNLVDGLLGREVGDIARMIVNQGINEHIGIIATLVAVGFVVWGASRFVLQLEESFGIVFRQPSEVEANGVRYAVRRRVRSIFYLAGLAPLIMLVFLLNILLPFILEYISGVFPVLSKGILFYIQAGAIFTIMLLVFMLVYRALTPTSVSWKALLVGGAVASLFLIAVNTLFGLYVAFVSDASFYGALGSVFALLIWTYWTSQGLLYGAEVAKSYSERYLELRN